jgi:hypothetical protein
VSVNIDKMSTPSDAVAAPPQTLSIAHSVKYPRLKKLGKQKIRRFLSDQEAYTREIAERTSQDENCIGRPVSLRFSIEPSVLHSLVDLRQLGESIDHISKVTDMVIETWLDAYADFKRDTLSASGVKSIVEKNRRMNMAEKYVEQRVVTLFADYMSLLRTNGLAWLTKENPKVAIEHIIEALRPKQLLKRVGEDLSLSHRSLSKDFLSFMDHVIARAECYREYTDTRNENTGSKSTGGFRKNNSRGTDAAHERNPKTKTGNAADQSTNEGKSKDMPTCLNTSCNLLHYLKDCKNTSKEVKDQLYAERAWLRQENGEQRTTRSNSVAGTAGSRPVSASSELVAGTSAKVLRASTSSEGRVLVSFGEGHSCIALPDLGADDNVIHHSLNCKLQALGMFIPLRTLDRPLFVDLAVKGPGISAQVTRQAQLTVVLQLSAGPLRLRKVRWLVEDNEMDEVLIGRPLLKTLGMDAAEHLSAVGDEFQDLDCASIQPGPPTSKLSRLLLKRAYLDSEQSVLDSVSHGDEDSDPIDAPHWPEAPVHNEDELVDDEMAHMIETAASNGMSVPHADSLGSLVREFKDIWRVSLGDGTPAKLPPLVVRLKPDAKPVRVKVRRYSMEQSAFLRTLVDDLVQRGLAFRNTSYAWCSAPLLVPKQGPSKFRFTVDLRPVNKQTVPISWPMPHLESELAKLQGSTCFDTFDLSHGYWQLPLAPDSRECQSFITPDGVFSPTRVLHGTLTPKVMGEHSGKSAYKIRKENWPETVWRVSRQEVST